MEHLPEAGAIPATSDIELTKKGEEYCRLAEACGVSFITITTDDPKSIGAAIDRLIGMLDAMDPDPDAEPILGWTHSGDLGVDDDREDDGDDLEPSFCNQGQWGDGQMEYDLEEECEDEGADTGDREPELGWTEHIDQTLAGKQEETVFIRDGEPDLGFVGHGTGWRKGEGTDDREDDGDDEEPNGDEADTSFIADDYPLLTTSDGSGVRMAKKLLRDHRMKGNIPELNPRQPFKPGDFDRLPWA